jgi:hypothetical protein
MFPMPCRDHPQRGFGRAAKIVGWRYGLLAPLGPRTARRDRPGARIASARWRCRSGFGMRSSTSRTGAAPTNGGHWSPGGLDRRIAGVRFHCRCSAKLVLLFGVNGRSPHDGVRRPGAAILYHALDSARGRVQDIMRSRPNLVPVGHRSPAANLGDPCAATFVGCGRRSSPPLASPQRRARNQARQP